MAAKSFLLRRSDRVHAFPGSSILVRQDEPSSMIAYTLSAPEFMAEVQQIDMQNSQGELQKRRASYSGALVNKDEEKPTDVLPKKSAKDDEQSIIDGYYSIVTRKYVAPSAGQGSETASFRAMVLETVRTNASELHYHQNRRLQGLKDKLVTKVQNGDKQKGSQDHPIHRQLSQRTLMGDSDIDHHQQTTELKLSSSYNDTIQTKGQDTSQDLSPHIKHSKSEM